MDKFYKYVGMFATWMFMFFITVTFMLSFIIIKPIFAEDRYINLQVFAKVLNLVQKYYVEEVDVKSLVYGGIKGMLNELDPHTNFLPPDIYKEFESETAGEFGGIGIEITVNDGILTIISPIEDTPAWQAGLKPDDKIVEINGESTKGLSLVEAAQKMKGKKGSKIRLGVMREEFKKPQVFEIMRTTVQIKSVRSESLDKGYLYLKLKNFSEKSFKEIKTAIDEYESKTSKLKGLVLDLRRNPGGLLDQAVQISDLFLDKGKIVSTIGRDKSQASVTNATKENSRTDFPIVVLINEYSASASEIVAGALKDNKRALIMGKRSFGKGSVQTLMKMGDGSGLKLTVARYYTPSGVSIQAEGIVPDVEVDEIDDDTFKKAIIKKKIQRESDIEGHLLGENEIKKSIEEKATTSRGKNEKEDLSKDYQVTQALNYLKAYKVMKNL